MANRSREVCELSAVQDAPTSLVARTVPPAPTAKQALDEGQLTPLRSCVVPEAAADQLDPPSVLRRMVPPEPTATQSWLSWGQLTPLRRAVVPDCRRTQLDPLLVETTAPAAPTATHCCGPAQLTPFRSLPWGAGFSQRTEPSAVRGPTGPGVLGGAGAGTWPSIGGQVAVKMSSRPQPKDCNPTCPFAVSSPGGGTLPAA